MGEKDGAIRMDATGPWIRSFVRALHDCWESAKIAAVLGGANLLTARRSTAARSASNLHAFSGSERQRRWAKRLELGCVMATDDAKAQ
jgi:hypothetical protein